MRCIRTLFAAIAVLPAALLLSLSGAGTASAETINCPNVDTDLADCQIKAGLPSRGSNRLCADVEAVGQSVLDDCVRFEVL